MEPIIFFSADGHASMPAEVFPDFLESRFHGDLPAVAEDNSDWMTVVGALGTLPPDVLAAVDERGALTSGGDTGAYDLDRRLQEMDAEGVAAEIVFSGTQYAISPFASANQRAWSIEHRAAGVRAYHRWLADFASRANGRLAPVAQFLPSDNLQESVAELRWVADHGFVATAIPGDIAVAGLPPLYDPYFEPFWAACAELGLVLSIHAGHGGQQGAGVENQRKQAALIRSGALKLKAGSDMSSGQPTEKKPTRDTRNEFVLSGIRRVRQAMIQIMLAGVFDRYPNLKLVLTEVRSDWAPSSLAHLDARFTRGEIPLKKKPSEYWADHCFTGASAIHRAEIEIRREIGVKNILFGRDYPHNDGTWPYTWDWIRAAFVGVPENEARMMLGENAMSVYGIHRAALAAVAKRIGPRPDQVLGEHRVDQRRIDHWQDFAGFNNPVAPPDAEAFDQLLDPDLERVRTLIQA